MYDTIFIRFINISIKDLIKCGNQVTRCYSVNRRSLNPIQLHFCNFTGKIETEIGKNNGYKKWDVSCKFFNYTFYTFIKL